jgi:autotransporter-associated beta strand protein
MSIHRVRRSVFAAAAGLALVFGQPAVAQTWVGPGMDWNTASNWSPAGVPSSANADIHFTGNALGTVNISASVQAGVISFDNTSGSYTLTSNPGVYLIRPTAINVAPGVAGVQTINLANIATGSLLMAYNSSLVITNSSTAPGTTLVIGPNTVIGTEANGATPGNGAIVVDGPGTTLISGGLSATGGAHIVGGLVKSGTGTLTLSNPNNNYAGGTFVDGGTLQLGAGTAIPIGTNVTAFSGTFSTGGQSNTAATAIGTLTLSGSGFRIPGGSNYYLSQVVMTGGTVDCTGSNLFALRFVSNNMGITTNAASVTASWIGPSNCRIQGDQTSGGLPITVAAGTTPSGIDLDMGLSLPNSSATDYQKFGAGTMRLTNVNSSGNITVNAGTLRADDVTSGPSGYGALGSGAVAVYATLQYGGPNATLNKNLTMSYPTVQVLTPGVNLTYNGVASYGSGSDLYMTGPGAGQPPSTLTFPNNQAYSGNTFISGNGIVAIPTIATGNQASPIGSGTVVGLGKSNSRGTLLLTGANANYTCDRLMILAGLYGDGAGGAIGVQNPGTTLTWSGTIDDTVSASLIKTGAGTLVLTATNNDYLGGTFVEGGTLSTAPTGLSQQIPINTDLTVFTGATFQTIANISSTYSLRKLTLNGTGTFRALSGFGSSNVNQLVMNGGIVDLTQPTSFYFYLQNTGAAITTNASSTTAQWLGGAASRILNYTNGPLTVTVNAGTTPSGIDLDAGVILSPYPTNSYLPFVKTGAGTMRLTNVANIADFIVQQGALRVDDVTTGGVGALGTGSITLNGGRLAYGGPTATLSKPFTVDTGGGGVDVLNAATTLTVAFPINTNAAFTKYGPGTLALNNLASLNASGIVVNGGRLEVNADAQLGSADVTVNPFGSLRYTASDITARTFTLNSGALEVPSGVTLTLNGAAVGGGFMRGAGTFAVTGGTALTGVTAAASTKINVNGSAAFTDFTNGSPLTIAAALPNPLSFNLFTNQGSGSITVGAGSQVNTTDFQSYGTLTLSPGSTAVPTQLTNTGSSSLYFNGGSRTFISTPSHANPNQFDAGIDLHGQNAVIAGGLFVNNGYVVDSVGAHAVIADFGSLVKGAGFFSSSVQTVNGGKYQSGNSPGTSSFGSFTFGPGGVSNYVFAIDDATGKAGPSPDADGQVSGWGFVKAVQRPVGSIVTPGDFAWAANADHPLTVHLDTLVNPTTVGTDVAGPMADFDATKPYSWPAVHWAGGYTGPNDPASLNAATAFDTSGFLNPVAGAFAWSLDPAGHTLSLTYTPSAVPEPGTLALLTGFACGCLLRRRVSRLHV